MFWQKFQSASLLLLPIAKKIQIFIFTQLHIFLKGFRILYNLQRSDCVSNLYIFTIRISEKILNEILKIYLLQELIEINNNNFKKSKRRTQDVTLFYGADDFKIYRSRPNALNTKTDCLTALLAAPWGFSRFFGPRAVPRSPAPSLYLAMVTSMLQVVRDFNRTNHP